MAANRVPEGQYTETIYGMIKEGKHAEVIQILNVELQTHQKSRAALSLLGYCYYQAQSFSAAADCYEQLVQLHPEVHEYQLYHAQSLYKACNYQEAMKVSCQLENEDHQTDVIKLQASIRYAEEDYPNARTLVERCPSSDSDVECNIGCVLFKEGHYEEACTKFSLAMQKIGYKADICYNIALCYYKMKKYAGALKYITEIIERGIKDHPELSVGLQTEGLDVRSVGNTKALQDTALIEAFNLKAAIEYQLKNFDGGQEALTDMPPRAEEELDPVTLHNLALMNMNDNPTQGFEKLQFLLQQNPCPPETFPNLLLLYLKYEYYDLAADVMAENAHLTYKCLSTYLYNFLDAVLTSQTAPEEAFRKLEVMSSHQTEKLRKLTKKVQDQREKHNDDLVRKAVEEYDEALECYIPVLMAQAKLYWVHSNYAQVEKLFRKSVEFCSERDEWKLNVAHVLFMRDKFKEACGFYQTVVKKHAENLLTVSAAVLGNLCVAYVMNSETDEAEELMKKIEKEEEEMAYDDPDKKLFHLCIVNLVIGTLYCAKGNYEFGVIRVMKSLEPYNKKLGTETWFYVKRCFISLLENMAKHMIMLKDSVIEEILKFLDQCEAYGRSVLSMVEQPLEQNPIPIGQNTVTYEARLLKSLFLKLWK